MSEYRYVVFPPHKQPTVDEAAELKNLSGVLSGRSAVGVHRKTGGLVIAFDASVYERVLSSHRSFAHLIDKWEVRGADLCHSCPFVKDSAALRPVQPSLWTPASAGNDQYSSNDARRLAAKELAAQEAVGRTMLGVHQTLARYAALQRFAASVPYLLIAAGTLAIIIAGLVIGDRLLDSDVEKRRDTTERVAGDAMEEPLGRERKPDE